jgi:hypothetical protein
MKYALLVYQSQESFDRRDAAMMAAGRAYGEALQAAGVFIGGAGLESPQTATTVSVPMGNGRSTTARMPRRKNFSPDSASLMYQIWMPHWNGRLAIPPSVTPRSRSVPCSGRIFCSEPTNEQIRDAYCH